MKPNPIRRKLSIGAGVLMCCFCLTQSESRATVVAVIDTGADVNHPALQSSLWTNPGETGKDANGRDKATNGIDDDGNGYVDDVHGWNFAGNTNDLRDRHGHGTHVSGLIASLGPVRDNPGNVQLMILKYYDPGTPDEGNLKNSIAALRYATKMGAKIINYSGGGFGRNVDEEAAVRAASEKGILLVAAAGNEKSNSDVKGYFPADYGFPNTLSVAAVDDLGRLIPSSNFGTKTVHLAAPGNKVLSSLPGGLWGRMTGTSQAAALTTGAAVRLLAKKPMLRSPAQIIDELVKRGTNDKELEGKTMHQVRIDPSDFIASPL